MAHYTCLRVKQDVWLEKTGVHIHVWEGNLKGGRLVITKRKVKWFEPNAKKPTWQGTWQKFSGQMAK